MPYNLSRKVVERMSTMLDQLLPGNVVRLKSENPHVLAYQIREAIASARRNKIAPYDKIDVRIVVHDAQVTITPKALLQGEIEVLPQIDKIAANDFEVVATASRSKALEIQFHNFHGKIEPVKAWAARKGFTVIEEPFLVLRRDV